MSAKDAVQPKVIALVGPTSSGKTALGVFLAQKLGGEIISADSRQVYRGLDIGTGKVTKKEMAGVPHHLLDIVSPKTIFNASDFVHTGEKALQKIISQNKLPLVVGGTGYYVDALLGRIVLPEVAPNDALREKLEKKTTEQLFALLQKKDPARAKTIEPEHRRRLLRALEIAEALGANPTPSAVKKYDVLWLGIAVPQATLEKRIRERLLARIQQGMVAEAVRLHNQGLSYKRMETLGLEYRSLARLLQKQITKEEFVVELERAIQHYAKRQARWFKRNPGIKWVKNKIEALRLSKEFCGR